MFFRLSSTSWIVPGVLGLRVPRGAKIGLAVLILSLFAQIPGVYAKGKGYQKARRPLQAVTKANVPLRANPGTQSKIVKNLPKGLSVVVMGRRGNWLRTEVISRGRKQAGWVYKTKLKILGVVPQKAPPKKSAPASVEPEPPAQAKKPARRSSPKRPFRFGLWGGVSGNLRLMKNHFRVGTDFGWGFGPGVRLGFSLEAGFSNLLLGAITPTARARLPWPKLGPVRVSVLGGLPIYYLSDSGQKDVLAGLRTGLEFEYSLGSFLSRNTRLFARGWTDILFFGQERVMIPIVGVLGLSFRF